jgi:hypothetical protein
MAASSARLGNTIAGFDAAPVPPPAHAAVADASPTAHATRPPRAIHRMTQGRTGGLSDTSKGARAFLNRASFTTVESAFCASMSAERHASDFGACLQVEIAFSRSASASGAFREWAKVDELLPQ